MKRAKKIAIVGVLVLVVVVLIAWRPVHRHLVAASLLADFEGGSDVEARLDERELTIGRWRARRYAPIDDEGAPVVLLLHGVHAAGIDEPRLMRFARLLASAGLIIATPEIDALREMRFDERAVREIDGAAHAIARHEHRRTISVVGISFGGGLALLAAAEGEHRADIGAVLAIGAHHDARRVARWWLGERIEGPDGERTRVEPERYGAGVLAYAYADEYFEGVPDAERAREALRARLEERRVDAELTPDARERLEPLRQGRTLEAARARLRTIAEAHASDLAAVSPAGRLGHVRARVFLLHGAGDPLIPAVESLWIAHELPEDALGGIALTPLIRHADHVGASDWLAKLAVVHLVAGALGAFE